MIGEFLVEAVGGFVAEVFLEVVGYYIGRVIVPVVTLGTVRGHRLSDDSPSTQPYFARRVDGKIVLSTGATRGIGLLTVVLIAGACITAAVLR